MSWLCTDLKGNAVWTEIVIQECRTCPTGHFKKNSSIAKLPFSHVFVVFVLFVSQVLTERCTKPEIRPTRVRWWRWRKCVCRWRKRACLCRPCARFRCSNKWKSTSIQTSSGESLKSSFFFALSFNYPRTFELLVFGSRFAEGLKLETLARKSSLFFFLLSVWGLVLFFLSRLAPSWTFSYLSPSLSLSILSSLDWLDLYECYPFFVISPWATQSGR